MNEVKINWATTEDYAKAKKVLEKQALDLKNEYLYVQVIEAMGKTAFMGDLKNWIKASTITVDVTGITAEETV